MKISFTFWVSLFQIMITNRLYNKHFSACEKTALPDTLMQADAMP